VNLSIQDWGAIGELVGGVAVIVTLGYLAFQIRDSNRVARLDAQARVLEMTNHALGIRTNPSASKIWLTGLADPDRLSPEETHAFYSMMYIQMNSLQITHLNIEQNPHIREMSGDAAISQLAKYAGFVRWWHDAAQNYGPSMTGMVEKALRQGQSAADHSHEHT
jgi:hypothetical protein